MSTKPQFLVNDQGEKIAVVISVAEYEKILEDLEDAEALREYHEAKASGEVGVPFDEAIERIERERSRK
jgi:PHD/YefM family antitoxin component YafN of YafNO toxin-antitoxin module